jgi:hypothetical protein
MRWLRFRRVFRRDAAHSGVAELLAAAAAPARPDELAGEMAAVAAFRREYRPADRNVSPVPGTPDTVPERTPGPAARQPATQRSSSRRRPRRPRRRGVAIAALATVVALVGGTAYAAGAGRLPDPVQRQLHEALAGVGVPPPGPRDTPTRTPGSAPAPSGTPSAGAHLLGLCRAWQSARANPGAPQPRPDERRVLAEAAGGQHRIEAFCAALVAAAPGATASPSTPAGPAPVTPTPGRPGTPDPGGPPATPPGQEKKGPRK